MLTIRITMRTIPVFRHNESRFQPPLYLPGIPAGMYMDTMEIAGQYMSRRIDICRRGKYFYLGWKYFRKSGKKFTAGI